MLLLLPLLMLLVLLHTSSLEQAGAGKQLSASVEHRSVAEPFGHQAAPIWVVIVAVRAVSALRHPQLAKPPVTAQGRWSRSLMLLLLLLLLLLVRLHTSSLEQAGAGMPEQIQV